MVPASGRRRSIAVTSCVSISASGVAPVASMATNAADGVLDRRWPSSTPPSRCSTVSPFRVCAVAPTGDASVAIFGPRTVTRKGTSSIGTGAGVAASSASRCAGSLGLTSASASSATRLSTTVSRRSRPGSLAPCPCRRLTAIGSTCRSLVTKPCPGSFTVTDAVTACPARPSGNDLSTTRSSSCRASGILDASLTRRNRGKGGSCPANVGFIRPYGPSASSTTGCRPVCATAIAERVGRCT